MLRPDTCLEEGTFLPFWWSLIGRIWLVAYRKVRPEAVSHSIACDVGFTTAASEVFTACEPSPRGPVFMTLLERTFGKDITTRTWDTVRKCAWA